MKETYRKGEREREREMEESEATVWISHGVFLLHPMMKHGLWAASPYNFFCIGFIP
jgi:hypothetical protein